jgi:toxin ParE1/3/4
MRIEWSANALADRRALIDYLETRSIMAAIQIDDRIDAAFELLRNFPEAGRLGRIAGTRELVVHGTPYVAAYSFEDDTVVVLALIHSARDWPDTLPD